MKKINEPVINIQLKVWTEIDIEFDPKKGDYA